MKTRRSFIKTVGTGATLSSVVLSSTTAFAFQMLSEVDKRKIRIGIIGAENSHAIGFGKMFNTDKKFPGVEVKYIWGETDEFAKNAAEKGNIPNIVKDPIEMLGKIDALIVDHRHAKYHLEAAIPFIKEGIPTFIDKPFCYRVSEGKEFLAMAKKYGTPVTSYSSIAHSKKTYDIKKQIGSMGKINQVVRYGPVEMDSKYGGIFFYGVHLLQPLMKIFGEDIERVRVTRNEQKGSASLVFRSGLYATLVFKNISSGWETFVETEDGLVELKSRVDEPDPGINYVEMVDMFRTGKEPRSHKSILSCVAVLEALEKSVASEQWEEVVI
ncbi:MAG: Gfo/Idh/MocA family oxidoreductase [Flavobacteriaceae bacterium]|nr:Gfo/Idh/MocA family oxidoreductase [Flavobacteriaceae bacterium]